MLNETLVASECRPAVSILAKMVPQVNREKFFYWPETSLDFKYLWMLVWGQPRTKSTCLGKERLSTYNHSGITTKHLPDWVSLLKVKDNNLI